MGPRKKKKRIKVTLVRSGIGRMARHRRTIRGLGLHRLHETVEHVDTPQIRGMLKQVGHLLRVEEA